MDWIDLAQDRAQQWDLVKETITARALRGGFVTMQQLHNINKSVRSEVLAVTLQNTDFWATSPCTQLEVSEKRVAIFYPEDGGSKFLRNVGKLVPHYT
jgi:hypothetical protein